MFSFKQSGQSKSYQDKSNKPKKEKDRQAVSVFVGNSWEYGSYSLGKTAEEKMGSLYDSSFTQFSTQEKIEDEKIEEAKTEEERNEEGSADSFGFEMTL